MAKPIKILKIETSVRSPTIHRVYISKRQVVKLPLWVRDKVLSFYTPHNERYRFIVIPARDQLEAMMRFQKLWAALITLEEKQDA